jgi:hypothetical protein
MGLRTTHRHVLGHGRQQVWSYGDRITGVISVTYQRQAGDYSVITKPVSEHIRFANVTVEDAGLHENYAPCEEWGVVVGEEKGVIQLTAVLERVEARRYESAKAVQVINLESKCECGHPIS